MMRMMMVSGDGHDEHDDDEDSEEDEEAKQASVAAFVDDGGGPGRGSVMPMRLGCS